MSPLFIVIFSATAVFNYFSIRKKNPEIGIPVSIFGAALIGLFISSIVVGGLSNFDII